jgi:hypothetical protein
MKTGRRVLEVRSSDPSSTTDNERISNIGICLAGLKQLNRQDLEDRKEKFLRGLRGLGGSNSRSMALFGASFTYYSPGTSGGGEGGRSIVGGFGAPVLRFSKIATPTAPPSMADMQKIPIVKIIPNMMMDKPMSD